MRINPSVPSPLKRIALMFSVIAVFSLLVVGASNASKTTPANPKAAQVFKAGGRRAVNVTPSRMPTYATVEIIAIRNLDSEHVLRDLEIEVRNNSPKPIYFMRVELIFPDFILPGPDGIPRRTGAHLVYGRREMASIEESANANDKPLNPGETYVFKIDERNWSAYEKTLAERHETEAVIKRISVRIAVVNFGDGTGYWFGNFSSRK